MAKIYWIKEKNTPYVVKHYFSTAYPESDGYTKKFYKYRGRDKEWVYAAEVYKNGKLWDNSHQMPLQDFERSVRTSWFSKGRT